MGPLWEMHAVQTRANDVTHDSRGGSGGHIGGRRKWRARQIFAG